MTFNILTDLLIIMEKLLTKIDERIDLHESQNLSFENLSELDHIWDQIDHKITPETTPSTKDID